MNKEEIKKIREALGLNQAEFGEKLGVSYQTVSNWETGQVKIPKTKIVLIEKLAENINYSDNSINIKNSKDIFIDKQSKIKEKIPKNVDILKQKDMLIEQLQKENDFLRRQLDKLISKISD
ncbi:helix-turn-helix domain-containing protein [bacterium]|nr:helix-turn-helix domain-containing protein [bacterium]